MPVCVRLYFWVCIRLFFPSISRNVSNYMVALQFGSIDRTYLDRIEDFLAAPQTKNAVTLFSLVLQTAFVVHLACCIWVL